MSRVGITKEEVRQAIAQLRNQGSPVTVRSIQAITGGSYSTVQKFWKDLRDEEIEMLGDGDVSRPSCRPWYSRFTTR